jgi:hypothetical protein
MLRLFVFGHQARSATPLFWMIIEFKVISIRSQIQTQLGVCSFFVAQNLLSKLTLIFEIPRFTSIDESNFVDLLGAKLVNYDYTETLGILNGLLSAS